jgi:hypothetical protein
MTMSPQSPQPGEPTSIDICALDDLAPERGTAAILGGTQIAVFRLADDTVRAVQQLDPYSGANVLARGLVGSHRRGGDGADGEQATQVPSLSC